MFRLRLLALSGSDDEPVDDEPVYDEPVDDEPVDNEQLLEL